MKVICYTSCYGGYFKDKIQSSSLQAFDIIYWYEIKQSSIDFNTYKDYTILICEHISKKEGYYSSDEFIEGIKSINPTIQIITYPLIVLNIFPFHKHAFGFLTNQLIDTLIQDGHSDESIIKLYNDDKVLFHPMKGFQKSLEKLKEIEKQCMIQVSSLIETYIHEPICIDSLFPSDRIMNYLLETICTRAGIDAKINYSFVNNCITSYHLNNSIFTPEMIRDLHIQNKEPTPNYKEYYLKLLIEYLQHKRNRTIEIELI